MSPELIAHIKRCKKEYDSWPDWKKASVVLQGDTMFGHEKLEAAIKNEVTSRQGYDKYLESQIMLILNKLQAMEEYLDIEFKSYASSTQYIKSTKSTKL